MATNIGPNRIHRCQRCSVIHPCLTLIFACIIYWQAKGIERVVAECGPEEAGIDLALLEHVSPIEWDNVLLYGEYVIDRSLIQAA